MRHKAVFAFYQSQGFFLLFALLGWVNDTFVSALASYPRSGPRSTSLFFQWAIGPSSAAGELVRRLFGKVGFSGTSILLRER